MKIERYMTRGIQQRMPLELQIVLWELQAQIRCEQARIDYLQVYELKIIEDNNRREQVVLHSSEQPEYEKIHHFQVEEPIIGKVFIIEEVEKDKMREAMMFAHEY